MINLPSTFLNEMQKLLGEDYPKFLQSMNEPENKGIFVNENKISTADFAKIADFKIEKIAYEPAGFCVENVKLGRHPLHHAGAFYVQDPSAMFTVNAYNFKGDETVLDMCASPGGKTIQIANRIKDGILVSNEIDAKRCEILYSNVERMGLKNVIITNDTPQNISKAYSNFFDVCLVDAPCSGEGMFRRGEEIIKEWNPNLPQKCADRQLSILEEANKCLKQGGVLIYSTCTYSKEENEDVILEFLKQHNYKPIKINSNFDIGIGLKEAVRIYPHNNKGEGQFVVVLKKFEQNLLNSQQNLKTIKNLQAEKFISAMSNTNLNLYDYKSFTYNVLNPNIIKRGVNYYTLGVRVSENKNNRIVPNHYLFSAFGQKFKNVIKLDFNSPDAQKYLRGETLEVNQNDGFGAVLINNCAVGGYKISDGKFKNYYPKGLRNH